MAKHNSRERAYDSLDVTELIQSCQDLGWWMSAALGDGQVCSEMKATIERWFTALDNIDPEELDE